MQHFIGWVPPEDFKEKVIHFQKKWSGNTITEVVEPHITLKAQGGLTPDRKWLDQVRETCRRTNPFRVQLGGPAFFGEDVLYLSVRSEKVYDLHKQMVQIAEPTSKQVDDYFELKHFVPHLTLAKTTYGLSKLDLFDMAKAADKEFRPFPAFEVDRVRVYEEGSPNRYRKLEDITLG
ncbi:2'-5' RNA ligase family protein [Halobacillus sp. Nhm2S1]|uniref:2'-5' RNA ligase family protein n=1 Tax=Halobacillus sp. Nhm2S1 TaxID=2866716 RepID=UPI001C72A171|nr:2'-5' RNA ligase family protein [Halobacillus sp. Nhm2S1]MBX0356944.1 2'-5' RNA ligase family protein [Halobacillus sp. Nhm2S1]